MIIRPKFSAGHAAIGFKSPWPEAQRFRPEQLVARIADACYSNDIGIYGLVSENSGDEGEAIKDGIIKPNSWQDRLGYLTTFPYPAGYSVRELTYQKGNRSGELAALVVERSTGIDTKRVVLIDAQSVIASRNSDFTGERFRDKEDRVKLVVIGGKVPNKRGIRDSATEAKGKGYITGVENVGSEEYRIGLDMVTHLAQEGRICFVLDAETPKEKQEALRNEARRSNLTLISDDNSHDFARIGKRGTYLDHMPETKTAEDLMEDLGWMIEKGKTGGSFGEAEGSLSRARWAGLLGFSLFERKKLPDMPFTRRAGKILYFFGN